MHHARRAVLGARARRVERLWTTGRGRGVSQGKGLRGRGPGGGQSHGEAGVIEALHPFRAPHAHRREHGAAAIPERLEDLAALAVARVLDAGVPGGALVVAAAGVLDLGEVREQRREVARLGCGRACAAQEEKGAKRGGAHGGRPPPLVRGRGLGAPGLLCTCCDLVAEVATLL